MKSGPWMHLSAVKSHIFALRPKKKPILGCSGAFKVPEKRAISLIFNRTLKDWAKKARRGRGRIAPGGHIYAANFDCDGGLDPGADPTRFGSGDGASFDPGVGD